MTTEKTKKQLTKILQLARRGVGGEKDNAKRILERLLKKHDLTLEEIENQPDILEQTEKRVYPYRTRTDIDLAGQIYAKITQETRFRHWKRRGKIGLEMTKQQHLEFSEMYRYYRGLLKSEISILIRAFIQKHKLFPDIKTGSSDRKLTAKEEKELLRMFEMMGSLKKSQYIGTKKRLVSAVS